MIDDARRLGRRQLVVEKLEDESPDLGAWR